MKLVRTSLTIPQTVYDSARIKAATERKSLSKYVTEIIKKDLPADESPTDYESAFGTIASGKPKFRVPSRDILYSRE